MKVNYDGKLVELEEGANGFVLAKLFDAENKKKDVAYEINGEAFDMSHPLKDGDEVKFIRIGTSEAFEILNHSTSHLMAEAIHHLFPDAKFGFGPAVEEGFYYDVDFGTYVLKEEDLAKIEAEMKKLAKEDARFVRKEVSPEEADEVFKDNPYKKELIAEHREEGISLYTQGSFTDLCKGIHLPSTGYIKHFKLLSIAGAYWRGDSKNKQLTRIYGTSWWTEEELSSYLELLERRKKNDHRKLGKELGLFFISDYGPGFPFFLPNGMKLKNALLDYWHEVHRRHGYLEIETPTMLSRELWETSGHWDHYKSNMYTTKIDEKDFAIKPMNCPGALVTYNQSLHSYKELPIRYAELGHVHRHEASGALNGLFRVRAFTQDDAHIFIREDQIESEVGEIISLLDEVYATFGLTYKIVLSTRPESDYIGTVEFWDKAEKALGQACKDAGHDYDINPGDGAFYGPKLDFKLRDSMGRTWQCGTIQLDLNLPHRFGCFYIDEHGEKKEPVMLHRVAFGSIERFIGIITENYGGAFPTWLAPNQVDIIPVNPEKHGEYAKKLAAELFDRKVRVRVLDGEDKLSYRLRQSITSKVPMAIVIGDKEIQEGTVNVRRLGEEKGKSLKKDDFVSALLKEIETRKEAF